MIDIVIDEIRMNDEYAFLNTENSAYFIFTSLLHISIIRS